MEKPYLRSMYKSGVLVLRGFLLSEGVSLRAPERCKKAQDAKRLEPGAAGCTQKTHGAPHTCSGRITALRLHVILPAVLTAAVCCAACSTAPENKTNTVQHVNSLSLVSPVPLIEAKVQPVTVHVDPAQAQEIGLTTTQVMRGFVTKTVEAPGRVGPNAELTRVVSTPSAGRAVAVQAKIGDAVKEGQVMAVIKSDPVGQVQSDLLQNTLQARADIKQQEVQLKLSKITYDRESKLYAEQVSAKADLQAAENQLEKDQANLAALKQKLDAFVRVAQERLTLLGAPRDSAARVTTLDKLDPLVIIRAPQDGLVIDREINPGELNDGSKPLFTLADLSQVWLFADIFEKDIEAVKKDQEAVVSVDSLAGRPFPAKIIWVGDSISPVTRTLPVRANVPNPRLELKPGMFARININAGRLPVLMVPNDSVVQVGDKTLVFVAVGDGSYQEREVTDGVSDGSNTEIRTGLQLGETVVVHGAVELLGTAMKASEEAHSKGDK